MSDAVSDMLKVSKEERNAVELVKYLTSLGIEAKVKWVAGYPVLVKSHGKWYEFK